MRIRNLLLIILFITNSLPANAADVIKPGKTCPKIGIVKILNNKKFTCRKIKSNLVWDKGVTMKQNALSPKPTPSPSTTITNFINFDFNKIPKVFDFSNSSSFNVSFQTQSNLDIDPPIAVLKFSIPKTRWEIPSQTFNIDGTLIKTITNNQSREFYYSFPMSKFDPIGKYVLTFEPVKSKGIEIDLSNNSAKNFEIEMTRQIWSNLSLSKVFPENQTEYVSFKNQNFKKYPWVGRNVALLTISNDYDPSVIARILDALDSSYDSYKEITNYSPSIARQFKGKLTITEMTPETVGCGAACGYLGATGIEVQAPLFQRLYNGVRDHDQFDEPLFYELGRNFWNYSNMQRVLVGTSKDRKWFDINTTGFAVFMRYFTTEVNAIPLGPNDGPNIAGLEFKKVMKNLMIEHRDSSTSNFYQSFYDTKYDKYGFGIYGFWSSLVYYFMPSQGEKTYVSKLFETLGKSPTATSTASAVQNFVNALSVATGRNVEDEFYRVLRFEDAKTLST